VQRCGDGELACVDVTCERAFFVVDVSGELVAQSPPERDQLVRPRLRLANLDQEALDSDEHFVNLALCRSGGHAMRSGRSSALVAGGRDNWSSWVQPAGVTIWPTLSFLVMKARLADLAKGKPANAIGVSKLCLGRNSRRYMRKVVADCLPAVRPLALIALEGRASKP